jgi:D-alanyl-D-alanine carboxypeptidase
MTKKIVFAILFGLLVGTSYSQKINVVKLDSLFQVLEANNKFMGSVAVSQNGTVVYSRAIGKTDVESNKTAGIDSKYRIGSISKMFTSALIFKATEDKKLSLDKTIDAFFPAIENAKKITIGNLLNHRSGIHNFTSEEAYMTYMTNPKSQQEMVAIIEKGGSDFEPNSKASYSNSNYVLLSYILEKTYKKTFSEIVNDKIVKPLGLKNTYVGAKTNIQNKECNSYTFNGEQWVKEPETDMSIPMGAGAMVSTPTDLTLFVEGLFAGKIISNTSLKQMTTLQDTYGMGIFKMPFHEKSGFGHTGGIDGFRSVLAYFPEEKLAVALTSNGLNYDKNNIMIAVLNSYFNMSFGIPSFKVVALKTEELDPYLGEYSSPAFPLKITITKDNLKLFAQATGQSAFPLEATDKDRFEFTTAGIKIEFKPNEKQLVLKQGGAEYILAKG